MNHELWFSSQPACIYMYIPARVSPLNLCFAVFATRGELGFINQSVSVQIEASG